MTTRSWYCSQLIRPSRLFMGTLPLNPIWTTSSNFDWDYRIDFKSSQNFLLSSLLIGLVYEGLKEQELVNGLEMPTKWIWKVVFVPNIVHVAESGSRFFVLTSKIVQILPNPEDCMNRIWGCVVCSYMLSNLSSPNLKILEVFFPLYLIFTMKTRIKLVKKNFRFPWLFILWFYEISVITQLYLHPKLLYTIFLTKKRFTYL